MNAPLTLSSSILINASPARVWAVLVDPQETVKYMFGCVPDSDWQPGSPLLWRGTFDGVEIVAVKGTVTEIRPEAYLAYTAIDPNDPKVADIPENTLLLPISLRPLTGILRSA